MQLRNDFSDCEVLLIKSTVVDVLNNLVSFVTGVGAKGKFSGGFDISAFGGLSKGDGIFSLSNFLKSNLVT